MNLMRIKSFKSFAAFILLGIFGQVFAQQASDRIIYTIKKKSSPTPEELVRYEKYDQHMQEIVGLYNTYAQHINQLNVNVIDGGAKGRAYFRPPNNIVVYGNSDRAVHMHEVQHAVGMGVSWRYDLLVVGRKLHGPRATLLARQLSGDPSLLLASDSHAFWPFSVNYPAEAARLEQRVNSVKMMGAIWTDMRALDMWLSRQIKSPANRCLGLAPGGMEAASLACVNGPEHAWDIFKVAGTENHRIRNIKTRQCLAVKQRAEAAILVLDSCDGDISSGNIWNMSIGAAAIKNVAQPTQCLGTTPNQEVGLLTCPATSLPLMP